MDHNPIHKTRHFFTTQPLPCPYLPDRIECRVVTELGRSSTTAYDMLTHAGFRRSHGVAYAPVCPNCQACVPVRINIAQFSPSRTQRRIQKRNAHLNIFETLPLATEEQFNLFHHYLNARHENGEMSHMDMDDYRIMVEETPVRTSLIEFRENDQLIAACLTDRLNDGLSAVYSFYDCSAPSRSLGTNVILWLVERARDLDLAYVYLGYWTKGSPKMTYKTGFSGLEAWTPDGWQPFTPSNI